jgi:hypothetical protein
MFTFTERNCGTHSCARWNIHQVHVISPARSVRGILFALVGILPLSANVHALDSVDATIQVECTGTEKSQVALRWGHPDYNNAEYMPLFTTKCGTGINQSDVKLLDAKSEFEVQTEGGIQTAYVIKITLNGKAPDANGFIELDHAGSPEVTIRGSGFTLNRSSGPNKYGEQNFRVGLPPRVTSSARIVAQSTGDRSDAQLAIRWGHPDFNDHSYFPLWTIKAGTPLEKMFSISDAKSEFEFQTEGGEGTGYHVSMWLGAAQGSGMQPNIEITHKNAGTNVIIGHDNVQFSPTTGNVYGEMNVRVLIPALPTNRMPPAPSGSGGVNFAYNYGDVPISTSPPGSITIQYVGTWVPGSGALIGGSRQAFMQDHPNELLNYGPINRFADGEPNLQPGAWKISVGTVANGQFFYLTSCVIQVAPGVSGFVKVDRPTRSCP